MDLNQLTYLLIDRESTTFFKLLNYAFGLHFILEKVVHGYQYINVNNQSMTCLWPTTLPFKYLILQKPTVSELISHVGKSTLQTVRTGHMVTEAVILPEAFRNIEL